MGSDSRGSSQQTEDADTADVKQPPGSDLSTRLESRLAQIGREAGDAEAWIELGEALIGEGDPEAAQAALQRAVAAAGGDPGALSPHYDTFFTAGAFDLAAPAVERVLETDPENYDAMLALSALRLRSGEKNDARALLDAAALKYPLVAPDNFDPNKPSFLHLRSFDKSSYAPIRQQNGTYRKALVGGHCTLTHLIESWDRYNRFVMNVRGRNLLEHSCEEPWSLVINVVGCPDMGGDALEAIAEYLKARPEKAVINHPDRVAVASRDENCRVLNTIEGVVFPTTVRFRSSATNSELLESLLAARGFTPPFILRRVGTHTGLTVVLIADRQGLKQYLAEAEEGSEHYAIQYVDTRGESGHYHKTRVFFIDGRLYPVAGLTSDHWHIHSWDRYRRMDKEAWMRDREQRFLKDPEAFLGIANIERLYAIHDALRLDFFGIDFTMLPDGRLFVFEANAAMRHNFDYISTFPYTRPHLERITKAFTRMVEERIARP